MGQSKPTLFAALRIHNYLLYFLGQVVSNTGTWMQRIAQDWLILEVTNSPMAVGITTALQFLPMLLFGLWGGLIADRYSKRVLMLCTQTVMGLLAATLAVLTLGGVVEVWHIYLIAFLLGMANVIDNPARHTFVNEIVPPDLVRNAVSLNASNFQIARLTGPAVAGVLISAVGSGWAFAINAVSFLAVLASLLAMRAGELRASPRTVRRRGQVREGVRYVLATPHLKWIVTLAFFVGTFGFNFPIILSAYVKNDIAAGPEIYGLLNTMLAIGSLSGALLAGRGTSGSLRFLFTFAGLFALSLTVLGTIPWFYVFAVMLILVGGCGTLLLNTSSATIQLTSAPELRGRVVSLYLLVFQGSTPLGGFLAGLLTERMGAQWTMTIFGGICLVATLICALLAINQAGLRIQVNFQRRPQLVLRDQKVRRA